MRFLKRKIAYANAFHSQSRRTDIHLSNLNSVNHLQSTNRPKRTKRLPDSCFTVDESRQTKNIVKNYGQAICKFSTSSLALPYLQRLIQEEEVELMGFVNFVNRIRDQIDGLHHFRAILLPNKKDDKETAAYRRLFKNAGLIFIKFFSPNWIFHSKIIHKKAHLGFRFKMFRRIQHPELFTYLKAHKNTPK